MAPSSSGAVATLRAPGIIRRLHFLAILLALWLVSDGATADRNNVYHMSSLCKNHFLQNLYRKIDGAVLQSQNERNLDCVITFQTDSILQRFMLRFEALQLDCNDHLFIYDGAHAIGNYKADLSCRNTRHSVGTIYTRTNFVTLKYVTDNWGTESNGFRLIITAFKDPKHTCRDFKCKQNEFCIDKDLVCDTVNHCGDNSDELTSALCTHSDLDNVFGLNFSVFVGIVVGIVLVCCVCVGGITVCMSRRRCQARHPTQQASPGTYPLQQSLGSNGAPLEKTLTYPGATCVLAPSLNTSSGNLYPPAGGLLGYSVLLAHCYYLVK